MKTAIAPAVIMVPKIIARDERGVIEQLPVGDAMSVLRITSKKGTVRANHYHKKDYHYCYLVSGRVRYVEREPANQSAPMHEWIIEPGQTFYTRSLVTHAMEFLEDSEFYVFTPRSGSQEEYENDVVHEVLIDPPTVAAPAANH